MNFLFHAPTIIGMVGIDADATLAVFLYGTALKTMKVTETQSRTETNVSGYGED